MDSNDASPLLTIGEFARLGGVSVKALRIYADIGLLPPAAIKPQSRYRLYSRSQMSRLHRILMLKNAGFPLAQIDTHLTRRDPATLSKIRAALISRAEEIRQQLSWIDQELHAATQGAPVVIKHAPEVRIVSQRRKIDSYDAADTMLRELATPNCARLVPGAIWHDCGWKTKVIDCEVFWVLNRNLRDRAVKTLPAATMASILHEGDESNIGETYEAARRWITDNRYQPIGPNREIYLHSDRALTEIQFPVRRKDA